MGCACEGALAVRQNWGKFGGEKHDISAFHERETFAGRGGGGGEERGDSLLLQRPGCSSYEKSSQYGGEPVEAEPGISSVYWGFLHCLPAPD